MGTLNLSMRERESLAHKKKRGERAVNCLENRYHSRRGNQYDNTALKVHGKIITLRLVLPVYGGRSSKGFSFHMGGKFYHLCQATHMVRVFMAFLLKAQEIGAVWFGSFV